MRKVIIETKETIYNYFKFYNNLLSSISELKSKNPAARFIQNPKLSSAITESLAHYLIKDHRLISSLKEYHLIGRGDLVYQSKCGTKKTLQIKSTGKQAFSKTSTKDLEADYLIWLDLSDLITSANKIRSFEVHILPNPGTVLPEPRHIRLKEFLPLPGVKSKKFITSSKFFTPECY